jgi:hypothetical protein
MDDTGNRRLHGVLLIAQLVRLMDAPDVTNANADLHSAAQRDRERELTELLDGVLDALEGKGYDSIRLLDTVVRVADRRRLQQGDGSLFGRKE